MDLDQNTGKSHPARGDVARTRSLLVEGWFQIELPFDAGQGNVLQRGHHSEVFKVVRRSETLSRLTFNRQCRHIELISCLNSAERSLAGPCSIKAPCSTVIAVIVNTIPELLYPDPQGGCAHPYVEDIRDSDSGAHVVIGQQDFEFCRSLMPTTGSFKTGQLASGANSPKRISSTTLSTIN